MNQENQKVMPTGPVKKKKPTVPIKKYIFVLQDYQVQKQIGNGVSSKVYSAIHTKTGETVAIKKIKNFLQNKHESLRILREILLLRKLKHPNIINLKQIIIEDGDPKNLSLVLEYLPTDIKKIFISNLKLSHEDIKRIIYQSLLGLSYCQQSQVLHRDLKPQNILTVLNFDKVKLCDFGLARSIQLQPENQQDTMKNEQTMKEQESIKHENHHINHNAKKNLTAHVVTRWYRAPELIILQRKYSNAIDMWSIGCILGQLLTMMETMAERKPLFPGKACYPLSPPKSADMNYKKINDFPHSVHDQLSVIFSIIGTPKDISFISDQRAKNYILSFGHKQRIQFKHLFKYITPQFEDFLIRSLQFNPSARMTISQALNHKLFEDIRQDYKEALQIKGHPINMQLQGVDIPQIKELVMKEYAYYQSLKKK